MRKASRPRFLLTTWIGDGVYRVMLSKRARKDLDLLKRAGLSDRAKRLCDVVAADPLGTPPPVKALVGDFRGLWSRRINIQHRFVYSFDRNPVEDGGRLYDGTVLVVRMWSHYEGVQRNSRT